MRPSTPAEALEPMLETTCQTARDGDFVAPIRDLPDRCTEMMDAGHRAIADRETPQVDLKSLFQRDRKRRAGQSQDSQCVGLIDHSRKSFQPGRHIRDKYRGRLIRHCQPFARANAEEGDVVCSRTLGLIAQDDGVHVADLIGQFGHFAFADHQRRHGSAVHGHRGDTGAASHRRKRVPWTLVFQLSHAVALLSDRQTPVRRFRPGNLPTEPDRRPDLLAHPLGPARQQTEPDPMSEGRREAAEVT